MSSKVWYEPATERAVTVPGCKDSVGKGRDGVQVDLQTR